MSKQGSMAPRHRAKGKSPSPGERELQDLENAWRRKSVQSFLNREAVVSSKVEWTQRKIDASKDAHRARRAVEFAGIWDNLPTAVPSSRPRLALVSQTTERQPAASSISTDLLAAIQLAPFADGTRRIVEVIAQQDGEARLSNPQLARACGLHYGGYFRRALGELWKQGVLTRTPGRGGRTSLTTINPHPVSWGRFAPIQSPVTASEEARGA